MSKVLVVIDMQNDFIDGMLGTSEAIAIVPGVVRRIAEFEGSIYFTKDTHSTNYLETQEGSNLPVQHCIKGTDGWRLNSGVEKVCLDRQAKGVEKDTFGSKHLPEFILQDLGEAPEEIVLVGVCTDICVISNAIVLKAFFPDTVITVDSSLCAGTSVESHENALQAMRVCQVNVV